MDTYREAAILSSLKFLQAFYPRSTASRIIATTASISPSFLSFQTTTTTTITWHVKQTQGKQTQQQPPLTKKLQNNKNGMYSTNLIELVTDMHLEPVWIALYAHLNLHNNNYTLCKYKCLQILCCINTHAYAANNKPQITHYITSHTQSAKYQLHIKWPCMHT